MKIIICGAGQVGYNIAKYLANEDNDITVIDPDEENIRRIGDTLDVRAILGHSPYPTVMRDAGAEDTDMLIAVSPMDETNMIACQVAHSLFNIPLKIARIRHQSYLMPDWAGLFSRNHMPIDVIISPEVEVAKAISRRLQAPSASEMISLYNDEVRFIGIRCLGTSPLLNCKYGDIPSVHPSFKASVLFVKRANEDRVIVPDEEFFFEIDDEAFFLCDKKDMDTTIDLFGHDDHIIKSVVVAGGGNIGGFLAAELNENQPQMTVKMIEIDRDQAKRLAQNFPDMTIINGDTLESDILEEVGIDSAGAFAAITSKDEANMLSSLLAKKYGCQRTITLVNNATYSTLMANLGLDTIISPRSLTISKILQHIRRGKIRSVHTLQQGTGEIIEADALETSEIVGKTAFTANLPDGVILGAIIRDDTFMVPDEETIIEVGDHIILYTPTNLIKKVEKLFSVRLEYF